jgi:hypothetical protein
MRLSLSKLPRTGLTIAAVALIAFGAAAPVLADGGGTGTVGVTGAASVVEANSAITAGSAVTINGADHTSTFSIPLTMTDYTGSGLGWNLTISASRFTSGTNTLATDATTVVAGAATCVAGGGACIAPSNGATLSTVSTTAAELFSAAAGAGMGSYDIAPAFSVAVPANTVAGSYTSTITLAAISAP